MKVSLACCAVLVVSAVLAPSASAGPGKRDNTPPTTPTNVRVVSVTEDSITIAWNASTDNSGIIHAYIAGGIYHPGTSTTKTFTGLVPKTTRTYYVQAIDPSGNMSGLSEPVTATTSPDTTPPTTPTNLKVTGTGISTVSLTWDRSSDRWSFSYDVLMDGQVVATVPHPYMGTPSTTLRKIPPGAHTFRVRARDTAGSASELSDPATVDLAGNGDTEAPTTPTDLTVEDFNDNCGSEILRWTGSSDDTDAPSDIEYELYLNGRFFLVTAPGESWKGLYAPAGRNTWTVVAVDRAGNSSLPSEPATVDTFVDPNFC
jgi:chitodextrinase